MTEHSPTGVPIVVEPGWTDRVDLGEGRAVLFYDDGTVRFEHLCHRTRDGLTIIIAPRLALGQGHTIVQREPLTIVASIACGDCPIHGWVTNGAWVSA